MPDKLVIRMRASIPSRQRSKTIARLIEKEVLRREKALFECAIEMQEWDKTLSDGLEGESW